VPDFLDPTEVHKIIDSVKNVSNHPERDYILCKLLWQSGARVTEAITLIPEHIGKSSVVLRNLKQVKKIRKKNPITKKFETTRIHDESAIKEVEISEALCLELREYCKANKIAEHEWVFSGNWRKSQHLTRQYVWEIIDKASRNAGIIRFGKKNTATGGRYKGVWPHIFRHSNGMILYEITSDLSLVQQQLGHASPSTTSIYAYAKQPKIKKVIKEIEW